MCDQPFTAAFQQWHGGFDDGTILSSKHVALQILPEHYPIVGSCLLRAIEEVLGSDIATPQVLSAWGAAYNQLADILIGAEAAIYDEKAAAPGGWRGGREFKLAAKVEESAEITSFYLRPVDQQPILDFAPGQYIGLKMMIDGEEVRGQSLRAALSSATVASGASTFGHHARDQ